MCTISKLTLIVVSQARPFPFCSANCFQCATRRVLKVISAVGKKGSGLQNYSHCGSRGSSFYMVDHPLCVVTVKVHDNITATFCRIVDGFQS